MNHSLSVNDFLLSNYSWGDLFSSPFQIGLSAVLQPFAEQNHAPQLCWLSSDVLACVWMSGGREGTSGMSILFSLLSLGSSSWSPPQVISQDSYRSEQNPLLFCAGDWVYLIHTAQDVRQCDQTDIPSGSSFSMQWTAKLKIQRLSLSGLSVENPSSWDLSKWSTSRELFSQSAFCRNPPVQRIDGSWLLPIYRCLEQGGAFGYDYSEVLVLTSNSSESFFSVQVQEIPRSIGRVHGSIVFSKKSNSFFQFFRSRLADRIYVSKSDVHAEQWSAPQPILLPNNNSSIQARILQSGRLAIIYDRFCFEPDPLKPQEWGEANWPRTRWPLAIALSEDEGITWPWIRDIDSGFGFCGTGNWVLNGQLAYPSILEGQPGELHIAYSWADRTAIRYFCLQEHDIIGFIPEY